MPGYEEQYEVSNYGDIHVKQYSYIDKQNKNKERKERYIWSENMGLAGGDKKQEVFGGFLGWYGR